MGMTIVAALRWQVRPVRTWGSPVKEVFILSDVALDAQQTSLQRQPWKWDTQPKERESLPCVAPVTPAAGDGPECLNRVVAACP